MNDLLLAVNGLQKLYHNQLHRALYKTCELPDRIHSTRDFLERNSSDSINKMERSKSLLNQDSKTIFRQLFSEYLSRSQVQGYKLILQTDRPFGEKALWLVIALFGVVLTSLLVTYSYFEFLESPTVTSEDPIRTSVLDLGFPAVSVCTANRISRKALLEYSFFM